MKTKRTLFYALLVAGLVAQTACTVKSETSEEIPVTESKAVGPYDVNFSNGTYEQGFDIPIQQDAGRVEYFVPAGLRGTIKITHFSSQVTGCDASQASVTLYWSDDAESGLGRTVSTNSTIYPDHSRRGLLFVIFTGLGGCTNIKANLRLTHTPPNLVEMPVDFLGDWNTSNHFGRLKMNIAKGTDGVTTVDYSMFCPGSLTVDETLKGTLVKVDTTRDPATFSFRIDSVPQASSLGCTNMLKVSQQDVGRYMNCIAERSPQYGFFNLGCTLTTDKNFVPRDYNDAGTDMEWRKY